MANHDGDRQVYYFSVKGSCCMLADERDKWRFLEAVCGVQQRRHWLIYAFCLTDDGAYFIAKAETAVQMQNELYRLLEQLPGYQVWNEPEARCKEHIQLNSNTIVLESREDIISCCRQIHRLPLREGYVSRLADYWWSSYITYIGCYMWSMMDCHEILAYFAEDTEEAQRRFRHFHSGRKYADVFSLNEPSVSSCREWNIGCR